MYVLIGTKMKLEMHIHVHRKILSSFVRLKVTFSISTLEYMDRENNKQQTQCPMCFLNKFLKIFNTTTQKFKNS